MFIGISLSGFFLFGLKKFDNELKINLSLLITTTIIITYSFEIFLYVFNNSKVDSIIHDEKLRQTIAEEMEIKYDKRTRLEVINDLKENGIKAYPSIRPINILRDKNTINGLDSKYGLLFPLGGISNQLSVISKEYNYWLIYKTDKFGFHNSNEVYDNNVDIAIIGDSFAEGISVKTKENICSYFLNNGFNTVNYGKSGNGPLLEYATIIEYVKPLKPKIVLWLYYENDLYNLKEEMESVTLKSYLQDQNNMQNLRTRQDHIDSLLINYIEMRIKKKKSEKVPQRNSKKDQNLNFIKILKLDGLRQLLNLRPILKPTPIFKEVLKKSKNEISNWGGKMYFVYLPNYYYVTGKKHPFRDFVLKTTNDLDIPIIDIHSEVFESHNDPISLFPFRLYGHYNAEGYELVSKAIFRKLRLN